MINLFGSIYVCWFAPEILFKPHTKFKKYQVVYMLNYTCNRLTLILLYLVLQIFKRTQIVIDPKYTTIEQIRKEWSRSRYLGIAIIVINVSAIVYNLIYNLHIFDDEERWELGPFSITLFLSVFLINILTLCNYYRMSEFYL